MRPPFVAALALLVLSWPIAASAGSPAGVRVAAVPDFDEEDENVPWDEEASKPAPKQGAPAKAAPAKATPAKGAARPGAPAKQAVPAAAETDAEDEFQDGEDYDPEERAAPTKKPAPTKQAAPAPPAGKPATKQAPASQTAPVNKAAPAKSTAPATRTAPSMRTAPVPAVRPAAEPEDWEGAPEEDEEPAGRAAPAVEPAALRSDVASDAEAERPAIRGTEAVALPERELNGHYFLPPIGLTTPFITSFVGATTSFGIAELELTDPEARANLRALEELLGADFDTMPLFMISQGLEFQLGLFDRLALILGFNGSAFLPRDQDTAWLMAADGAWGARAGLRAQALKTRALALSGSVDYGMNTMIFVSPIGTIGELLTTGELNEETMFTLSTGDTLSFGAQAAASPHPLVGFLAEGALDLDSTTQEDQTTEDPDDGIESEEKYFRLGFGASVDFMDLDVPLGVVGSYIRRFPVDDDNDTVLDATWSAGLFYTGRRYLLLGLEGQILTVESETDKTSAVGAALRIRAYF